MGNEFQAEVQGEKNIELHLKVGGGLKTRVLKNAVIVLSLHDS